MRRGTWAVLLCFLLTPTVLAAGAAGSAERATALAEAVETIGACPTVDPALVLSPGERLRVASQSLELFLARGEDAGAAGAIPLDINLTLRRVSGREDGPAELLRPQTATYKLIRDGAEVDAGAMRQLISPRGAGFGAVAAVPAKWAGEAMELTIELADNTRSPNCPPIQLRYRFTTDGLAAFETAGTQRGSGQSLRMNLLGSADFRPNDDSSDIWGYHVGNTHIAIMGSFSGTLFIDVSDPSSPVEVGYIPGPSSSWRDIKTYLNYAYIITEGAGLGQGMQVVDLSDPFNPTLVNTFSATFATAHNIWIDEDRGHAWIVGTNAGTRILDLADPVNPVEIGSWGNRYVHDAYVADGLAYFSEIFSGIHEILDASDPANLQILSTWATPDTFTHNSWPNADRTLLVTTDEVTSGHMTAYDISDKNAPGVLLGEYEPNPVSLVHNVFFDDVPGNRVAMSHYRMGVRYVDLQRPTVPIELGFFDTVLSTDAGGGGSWGVYPFDPRGYFYVSDIETGLRVVEYVPDGGALTGRVVDATSGDPIVDASVQLLLRDETIATNAFGDFGSYVRPGETLLRVSAPGYSSKVVAPGTLVNDGGIDIEVALNPLPRGSVTGTVTDASTGQPIVGASVSRLGGGSSATTDASGGFTLVDFPVGQSTVTAEAAGYTGGDALVVLQPEQIGVADLQLRTVLLRDDMELDQGWTRGIDTATTGAWTRVDPNPTSLNGVPVQPDDDHSPNGVTAFITGQSLLPAPELSDVDEGITQIISPLIDLTQAINPQLTYYRWVSTEAGDLDGGSMRVELTGDAGANWTTVELTSTDVIPWQRFAVNVSDVLPGATSLQMRVSCEAFSGMSSQRLLECGLDDVELLDDCRARLAEGGVDFDRDGLLDSCDECPADALNDIDGDGVCGDLDNAPAVANAGQQDGDADGVGDVSDNCPTTPNSEQFDIDRDGVGDLCDADRDGDGLDDGADADRDGDGVDDVSDNCPDRPNAAQSDVDANAAGDACDLDDGVVQAVRFDGLIMRWQAESAADEYHVYRGSLGSELLLSFADCLNDAVVGTNWVDAEQPDPGNGFFFLVAPVDGGVEGSLGFKSSGLPRTVTQACP